MAVTENNILLLTREKIWQYDTFDTEISANKKSTIIPLRKEQKVFASLIKETVHSVNNSCGTFQVFGVFQR